MLIITFFASFLALSSTAEANAVQALKTHIRFDEYEGTSRLGEKCTVDFITRVGGSVWVQMFAPRRQQVLVTPELAFQSTPGFYTVTLDPQAVESGTVTMSLEVEGRDIRIVREFCGQRRCWVSSVNCVINR